MYWRNSEYQPIKPQEIPIIHKPLAKTLVSCLIIIQLILLTFWFSSILGKQSQTPKNLLHIHNFNFGRVDVTYLKAEIYETNKEVAIPQDPPQCGVVSDNEKFDCFPESGGNQESCIKRGCCWEPKELSDVVVGVPWCYYPKNYGGYKTLNVTHSKSGTRVFYSRTFPSPYPDDIKMLKMDVTHQGSHRVHVKIVDAEANRYEPPYPEMPMVGDKDSENLTYKVVLDSIGFRVVRDSEEVVFDCGNLGGFIFADQFLQMSAKFEGKIYGLGEQETSLQLNTNWTKFTLFSRDGDPLPNNNLYGTHPFYLVVEPSGKSHGVYFHNSNAMDVLLQPLPAITFRSIGGIFEFYFFMGPTPADVIKQYTELIGRTFFPPYWSLGFHLSRFGYKNTDDIRAVWKRTRDANIPFDTQWHDLDYMERRNDFTLDKQNYGDLPEFIKEIHDVGMHYIPIVDPGISGCEPNGSYPPFDEGVAADIFIKNLDGSLFKGKVWNPNCTVFPDFTAFNAIPYWSKQLKKFHDLLPFDGIWIDMNEPSNFFDGSAHGCPSNKWENPPYLPNVLGGKLRSKTICMSTVQAAGLHYDLHNLYGISEAIATNRGLKDLGKRPFIISRSTSPGIGRYAGHWSGDVQANWSSMKFSIPKMLSFSLFGVPMMGADICGFDGNTTVLLCQRWSQLGAFYPFSRNHNSDDCIDQDPVALGAEVVNSTRKALNVRYTLLPYLYTLFFKAHTEGETVARPLFFEFGDDPRTLNLDESFLWGCCVLVVPVLKEYATTVKTYLPAARWYNWFTGLGTESNGTEVTLHAPSDTIPVFIRGGAILPTQQPSATTTLSRLNDFELIVAADTYLRASGSLYWDDGESLDTFRSGEYLVVDFVLTPNELYSRKVMGNYKKAPPLGLIKIFGFVKPIKQLYFNKKEVKFDWSPTTLILSVKVKHPINESFVLQWKFNQESNFRQKKSASFITNIKQFLLKLCFS